LSAALPNGYGNFRRKDNEVSDTAYTRIERVEKRKRGFFGFIFKWLFILFNLLMILWLGSYLFAIGDQYGKITSDAERTGAAIGATMGTGMLLVLWALGDLILGMLTFFTRGKMIIVETRG
jgi:hypothetical protein